MGRLSPDAKTPFAQPLESTNLEAEFPLLTQLLGFFWLFCAVSCADMGIRMDRAIHRTVRGVSVESRQELSPD